MGAMAQHAFDLDPFADGYVEEPPAPEPQSKIQKEPPPPLRARLSRRIFCQIGHRCALLAFLALLTAVGLILYRRPEYWHLLLVAFLAADTALLCGLIASWLRPARPQPPHRLPREALGLVIFSLLMLIPTVLLVVLAKADRLGDWIDSTWTTVQNVETWVDQRLNQTARERRALADEAASLPPGVPGP